LGDSGAEGDDGLIIEEPPPPKGPSKHEVSAAIDVLQTYSLFLNNQFVDLNSGIEKLCNIIDRDRMAAKRQGLMTLFFKSIM